ncbi:DUF4129 domain-containing protein [Flavobacterium sp. XGLA_31]|uniref:DUF4129 domain-containing protein n=1 Tax=Flavobacterium sp. XGLA_31 TaxID=3447666 RepID=UPI003F311CE3
MNKLFFFFWLLLAVPSWSQDSLATAQKAAVTYTEKDIKTDQGAVADKPKLPPHFKEKYQSDDFKYEVKLGDQKSIWERFKEWLAHWFREYFGFNDNKSKDYVDIALKIIAVLIVVYVIYLIVKIILNKEGEWVFGKSTTKKIIHDDDIEKNLIHVDFEKLIKETLKSGDSRLVIRYYYLWTLKQLSERSLIEWHADKTNSDYLYEIQSADLKTDFQYLSYLYNYIWYGEFEINEQMFLQAQKAFENTLKSIR